ncbi:MAG: hypothetical protein ACRC2N_01750 [Aeromonas sp.]
MAEFSGDPAKLQALKAQWLWYYPHSFFIPAKPRNGKAPPAPVPTGCGKISIARIGQSP